MIFGTLVAMAIGIYFGVPLLPLLVAGALLQCCVAFVLTKNPVVIQVTVPVAIAAVGTFLVVPMLTQRSDDSSLPFAVEWFSWATGAIAAIGLIGSTYVGAKGGIGAHGPNRGGSRTRAGASQAAEQENEETAEELSRLCLDDLSMSHQMRRGGRVESVHGQAIDSVVHVRRSGAQVSSIAASSAVDRLRPTSDDGDFSTSALVGASTGNTMLGYVVGGSLTGALVGSTLHRDSPCDDRTGTNVGSSVCDTSNDSSLDSDSSK